MQDVADSSGQNRCAAPHPVGDHRGVSTFAGFAALFFVAGASLVLTGLASSAGLIVAGALQFIVGVVAFALPSVTLSFVEVYGVFGPDATLHATSGYVIGLLAIIGAVLLAGGVVFQGARRKGRRLAPVADAGVEDDRVADDSPDSGSQTRPVPCKLGGWIENGPYFGEGCAGDRGIRDRRGGAGFA